LNVLTANPGLTFADAQLNQIARGTLVLSTSSGHGCITHLRYGDNDRDLDFITLSDAGATKSYSSADIRNLAEFRERGKWIFAICHGIQVLARAGLLTGVRATTYEHCRTDVEQGGGKYVADQQAVRDGRLVTGQTWQSHPEFYREVMACLAAE
jgi:transcriptional regulator GlxA family with amidase domain